MRALPLLIASLLPLPLLAHPGHADSLNPDSPLFLALAADPAATPHVTIETRDGYRHITSTGLPDHPTGRFPNRNNPNSVRPQEYRLRAPLNPKPAPQPIPLERGFLFGIALNGVPFDPGTAEYFNDDPSTNWRMEAINGPRNLGLDAASAHVQPSGAYHYHGIPTPLLKQPTQPTLLGYAADGYPIYGPLGHADPNDPKSPLKELKPSYQLKPGPRGAGNPPGNHDGSYTRDWTYVDGSGDLDESNGRTAVTPEFPNGTYHYVLTPTFPFIPRSFHATPDPSFATKRPPPGGRPVPRQRPPRGRYESNVR